MYQAQFPTSVQSPPQLPPKIHQQPTLPPKIPIDRDIRSPELPPKIKLHDDKETCRSGPTTDGNFIVKISVFYVYSDIFIF